ncbi:MAG TPA: hypothetical protein VGB55_14215 [Tepidisphaeraceae bacterium]|jgi:integrase
MKSTTKKGRPQAFYRTSWGDRIDGLTRLADGRWKISGPKAIKFTEPDERMAIAIFRRRQAEQSGTDKVMLPMPDAADGTEAGRAIVKTSRGTFIARIPKDGGPVKMARSFDTADLWAWLREQIIAQPKWVAERVGIEQIGYLTDLKKPTESLALEGLDDVYAAKAGISKEEITRCRRFWAEFVEAVGVKTLRELSHEHVELYEAKIAQLDLSPKSVKHRYTRIRTAIAWVMKRGKGAEDCRKALDVLSMLDVPTPDTLDPNPIKPAQFWAIHKAAKDADNQTFAAMMLFSLNCALYPSEAGAVRWTDVDLDRGEFVTRRNKTKVPRVAVLWPETITALKSLPQDRPTVFNTSRMAYQRFSVFRDWKIYRDAAKLPNVKYAEIRDAAFTAACRVDANQARILAGHRMQGAADHYVMRAPQAVGAACEAIRKAFNLAQNI